MTPDEKDKIAMIDEIKVMEEQISFLERRVKRLTAAQTCVSCQDVVCPPMQCGSCIEREEPAQGMPARPVTTAFREALKSVLAAFTVYVNIPTEKSWDGIAKAVLEASQVLGECPVPHPKG